MTKIIPKIQLMAFALFLSACSSYFPTVQSSYISPLNIHTKVGSENFWYGALSPDGQSVVLNFPQLHQVKLDTGEERGLFDIYPCLAEIREPLITSGTLDWSPDGRYLAITGSLDDRTSGANRDPIYILDTKICAVSKTNDLASRFGYWSPFNTGHFMASGKEIKIFSLDGSTSFSLTTQYDFRAEKEVGGIRSYLWSKRLDMPVAILLRSPMESPKSGWTIGVASYAYLMDYEHPEYFVKVMDDIQGHLIGAAFDPTGEYVLVAQWICNDTETVKCSYKNIPAYTSNVTDTILTLVRWRTGEKYELFRLSEIATENLAASGDLVWSADGSTILVGRFDAPFIVLKVK